MSNIFKCLFLIAGVSLLAFSPASAQTVKTTAASTPADFSAVENLVCRGYYNQSEGGKGDLRRPESAFKTTQVKSGHFGMRAARAVPGASRGWETSNGESYLDQGSTEFKVQPDGSWYFQNPVANSKYFLTPAQSSDPSVKKFTVRYEADSGWASGQAECKPN